MYITILEWVRISMSFIERNEQKMIPLTQSLLYICFNHSHFLYYSRPTIISGILEAELRNLPCTRFPRHFKLLWWSNTVNLRSVFGNLIVESVHTPCNASHSFNRASRLVLGKNFWIYLVKFLVFSSPPGYKLWSFTSSSLIQGLFYGFLKTVNDFCKVLNLNQWFPQLNGFNCN